MSEEKRKFLRFECLVPVEFVRVEGRDLETGRKIATLDEISREGLRVVMDVDLNFSPGTEVDLKINIPDRRLTSRVCGEVMWVKPKGKHYELGIRIKSMDKIAKSELLDLGYEKWRDTPDEKNPDE
jgi:hypothetical protein